MEEEGRATGVLDPALGGARHDRGRGGRGYFRRRHEGGAATYAALDLGTNNCRLLVARPTGDGFRVIDAFSRIIRLGEGVSTTRRAQRSRDRPRHRGARRLSRQDAQPRRHPRPADRHRSVSRGRQWRRVPRPRDARGRARSRDRRPRDRGRAGRDRLHAADRSRGARRHPVRHRRRLVRTGAARPVASRADAVRPSPGSRAGCRCRSAW